ncbi:MAG: hypothetical protein QOI34_328 [Verrucomicrobiota bacterium]|jgi:hypothetical protein
MTTGLKTQKAREIEWEVLPPEEERKRAKLEPIFRWLAVIMDEFVRLPGTRFRFGLDPVIGLIPGLGDTASAIASALTLVYAARCGLPKILLARMSLNILINEFVGIIPGIGDAFSFWFKSNARNYALFQQHVGAPARPRSSDWAFVGMVLGLLFLFACAGLVVSFFVLREIAKLLGQGWR